MDEVVFYWSGWEPILRILVVGTLTYITIILLLRISGKRTFVSMNSFDFIITIALGSAFGRILTATSVSISEAVVTFTLLIFLQYILSVIEMRSSWFKRFINANPALLFFNGQFLDRNLRKERINKSDIRTAVRKKGLKSLDQVEAVVLETEGGISVIKKSCKEQNLSYQEVLKK